MVPAMSRNSAGPRTGFTGGRGSGRLKGRRRVASGRSRSKSQRFQPLKDGIAMIGTAPDDERERENGVMNNGFGGGMMFGMGLFWLIALVVAVLVVAALIKYLRK